MKLIRYLEDAELLKSVNTKQDNGFVTKEFSHVNTHKIQIKTIKDEVNATIYGADIVRMFEISTPLGDLEKYLITKVDNKEDNISLYFIKINNTRYKINSVTQTSITIERLI